jgi:hypothetical protein
MTGVKQNKRPKRGAEAVNGRLPTAAQALVPGTAAAAMPPADGHQQPGAAAQSATPSQRPATGRRLTKKQLGEQLDQAAARCLGRPLAQRIRRLSRLLTGKPYDQRRLRQSNVRLAECLDVASKAAEGPDRWAACEAVAWGVAWLVRNRKADATAGGLLERLVRLAGPAAGIGAGDSRLAAPFAVTLAGLFDDVEGCRALGVVVRDELEQDIAATVGENGGLRCSTAEEMLDTVCGWLRCREVISATGGSPLPKASLNALDQAVTAAVRLLGGRGCSAVAGMPESGVTVEPLLRAARRGRRKLAATVAAVTEGRDLTGDRRWSEKGLLAGSFHDREAAVAVLRSGWTRDAVRVLVTYQADVPVLEIAVGSRLVVAGPWEQAVDREGSPLPLVSGWRASRWEANDEAVYFELVADLATGLRLERAVLVLTEDNIVMLGDAIVLPTAGYGDEPVDLGKPLSFQSTLMLPPPIGVEACEETTEIFGCDLKPRFLALPLGLSEWRHGEHGGRGSLVANGQRLILSQTSSVSRLYAPLWLDLDARRLKQLRGQPQEAQRTWRQLTVADTRERLTNDQAVGYRVQAARDQWLVYRTLDESRNRTLLGCNLSCEFFAGRFGTDGEAVRSMEVFNEHDAG